MGGGYDNDAWAKQAYGVDTDSRWGIPTTPSLPSPTTTRSTPARFRLTTTSGPRTTTDGPPRTRRATATPPLPTSTLLLASTSPTLMLLPMATDTVTDMPDTATATDT